MLVGTCTCQPKAEDVDYMFEETGKLDNLGMGRHFAGLLAVQVLWGGSATNFAANFIFQPMIAAIDYTMGGTLVGIVVSGMLGMGRSVEPGCVGSWLLPSGHPTNGLSNSGPIWAKCHDNWWFCLSST